MSSRQGYESRVFGVGEDPALGFKARLNSLQLRASHDLQEIQDVAGKKEKVG